MKKLLYTMVFLSCVLGSGDLVAQTETNLDKALRYVEQNAQKWELTESDYTGAMVSDMYTNEKTGITYIYLTQAHANIPVVNAITPIVISPQGKVMSGRHGFVKGLETMITAETPSVTPLGAIKSTVSHLNLTASTMPALKRSNTEKNIYEFGQADFCHNEISVKLMYLPTDNGVELVWSLAIDEKEDTDYYNTFVNAVSGEVVSKYNYTKTCQFEASNHTHAHADCNHDNINKKAESTVAEAASLLVRSYNVFPLPIESPIHGVAETVVDPYFTDLSPFGWHDTDGVEGPEFTITRGNNVHAAVDKDDDGVSDGGEPDGGQELAFDLIWDENLSTEANEGAAAINLFYMNNMMHDITGRVGFDEAAGNFQATNYTGQGSENDYVIAGVAAGFGLATPELNNATFSTPPDGGNGRMRMFLWDNPSGNLSIDQPEELAGFVADVGTANYGSPVPTMDQDPVSGKIVLATDGLPNGGTTVCNEVSNIDEVAGNIAMVDRGLCDFVDKSYYAQEAGAVAVIICNVVGGGGTDGLSSFGIGSNPANPFLNDVVIPTISLGKTDCDRIRASILSEIDVTVTLQQRPPMGQDYLDGSLDNGIIAHEYGHGISNRLIGGPSAAGCMTNDEQMGEGISDYFSLAMTVEEGDQGTDPRGIGNYASALNKDGRGIRRFPYSTDLDVFPLTYDDIKTSGIPHPLGEIWAVTLWEIHWAFIEKYGLDTTWEDEESGNFRAMRLIIEGMKQTACNPSMIDTRDGIFAADTLLNDGAHGELLWTAFAKRGMGYLADDGVDSNDRTDGTESFEPLPTAIQSLKVQEEVTGKVLPGDEVTVRVTAQNHIPETQTGVVIKSIIPDGLSYIDGSASMTASHDNGVLTIEVGDMALNDEVEVTYLATADGNIKSETLYYDDIEDPDFNEYQFGAIEGGLLWDLSELANSGENAWYATQLEADAEIDYWMNTPSLSVFGENPALRFWHRYETEAAADAGFLQISTDDGVTFFDVKDKFIRNGYPLGVQYGTFAIPLLEGFSGSTDGKYVDSYLDLSDYKGQDIRVRFRFGSDDNTFAESEERGWYVDDIEILDLTQYSSNTCISSNESDEVCADANQIIIDSDGTTSTKEAVALGFEVGVAPNPASEYVSVTISAEQQTAVQLSLTSIDGRVIKSQSLKADKVKSVRSFDTSGLQAGMYLIQIRSERGVATEKVIIQ